jgi:hypothetical protein
MVIVAVLADGGEGGDKGKFDASKKAGIPYLFLFHEYCTAHRADWPASYDIEQKSNMALREIKKHTIKKCVDGALHPQAKSLGQKRTCFY